MNVNQDIQQEVQQFCDWYGDGTDGRAPSAAQWQRVLARSFEKPLTLINFFKFRSKAVYPADVDMGQEVLSGNDAFGRYSAVSMPAMQQAGGSFLHVGPFFGNFTGADEDWDIVAIGAYPDLKSFLKLFTNPAYQAAFVHRVAACEHEKVLICE